MKRIFIFCALAFGAIKGNAQLSADDIQYFIGTGPDTAYLVIDFQDGSADSSYAWGYLFDEATTTTAQDMLTAIDSDEEKISFDLGGGFLNDIIYNSHEGLGGMPNYWGTWSRTSSTAWAMNSGISEVLSNGDWFGCSYTDFSPAIEPGEQYAAYASNAFSVNDVIYWVGTGSDSAVLVIDFVTPTYSEQISFAWGYLFDGTTDGATMLEDIATSDVNLAVNASAFLNDIYYAAYAGEAGTPHYWGTWSGTNLTDWTLNMGLPTVVNPGDWFGCSYDAWEPRRPFNPIAAIDSAAFTVGDLTTWVGTGSDSAVIVIDFNESQMGESFAFGFLFDGTASGEDALNALATEEPTFLVNISGGFLMDINYLSYEGLAGVPNYWSTWSSTNAGGWELNIGIATALNNGDWFACSYTDWQPNRPPSLPEAGISTASVINSGISWSVYPNPVTDEITIQTPNQGELTLYDAQGNVVAYEMVWAETTRMSVSHLSAGNYVLVYTAETEVLQEKIIVQ